MKLASLVIAALMSFSCSAFAKDYKQLAAEIVTNMYGQPGDSVVVNHFSNPNAFQVVLSNGATVGSASYTVEFFENEGGADEGEVVANIKVTYEGGN